MTPTADPAKPVEIEFHEGAGAGRIKRFYVCAYDLRPDGARGELIDAFLTSKSGLDAALKDVTTLFPHATVAQRLTRGA